jgi:hypothetical protein
MHASMAKKLDRVIFMVAFSLAELLALRDQLSLDKARGP